MLAALLNSPIAEAFTYAYSFQRDIPKRVYAAIPIPEISSDIKQIIDSLVYRYLEVLQKDIFLFLVRRLTSITVRIIIPMPERAEGRRMATSLTPIIFISGTIE